MLVGKYRILAPIGGGGMGFVYRALNPDLGCAVALKVVRAAELASPEALRRFERECQALARFRHPNIVTVHDAGQHEGQPFLVMEYLGGGSLARNVARFQSDPRAAVALVEKVARAVQQLHAEGVLHRDLKPANVLLDDAGEPRVGDFGLVKLLDSADELTGTGRCPGTAPYMAPEQTGLVAEQLGPPTDVWALGVILYELLLGGRPFTGTNRPTLFHAIIAREPARPRALRPAFDGNLEAVLLKALEKDPAQRFATAGALADELARWLRGEPTRTQPPGRVRRLLNAGRCRPWATTAALLLVLAVIAAPVALRLSDPDRPLRTIDAQLRRGEPVMLIDRSGPPRWRQWVYQASAAVVAARDDYFGIEAPEESLLALVPSVPVAEYELRAKVRHVNTKHPGEVGLFVGLRKEPTPNGEAHFYYHFTFNDIFSTNFMRGTLPLPPPPMQPNLALLSPCLRIDAGLPTEWSPRQGGARIADFAPAGLGGGDWHLLSVAVRGDRLIATFDGKSSGPVWLKDTQAQLRTYLVDEAAKHPDRHGFFASLDPTFAPSGAAGVVVSKGTALFSEVVLQPLEPE